MTELLIETGNGTTMPHTTTEALNDLFTSFKAHMNDIGLDPSFKLSATGDWLSKHFPDFCRSLLCPNVRYVFSTWCRKLRRSVYAVKIYFQMQVESGHN